jgi:hypothetical protein
MARPAGDLTEAQERAADAAAQERAGATAGNVGTLSPGFVAVPAGLHPDHGDAVTFAPGELLPGWAAELLAAQRPEPDAQGVYRLERTERPEGRRRPRKETT